MRLFGLRPEQRFIREHGGKLMPSTDAKPAPPATDRVATATEWVSRLEEAKRPGRLDAELRRLGFIPLLLVDRVGYIPFMTPRPPA